MNEDDTEPKSSREEWDSPITFTAKSSRKWSSFYLRFKEKQSFLYIQFNSSKMVLCEQYLVLMAECD